MRLTTGQKRVQPTGGRPHARRSETVGYARVSTGHQDLAPQIDALRAAGCTRIVEEWASGADRDRPELAHLIGSLQASDTLVVVRIDRLARSLDHLLGILERLKAADVAFRSLGDPIDTGGPSGTLILQILGAVAEFERNLISERTRAGVAAARARGREPGNPRLRAGDPEAIRKVRDARDAAYLDRVVSTATDWLPAVRELRGQRRNWDQVARVLNARVAQGRGGGDPGGWTADRIARAVRRLVDEGLAERNLLEAKRRPNGTYSDAAAIGIVRSLLSSRPDASLAEVAAHLKAMGERTPRGSTDWAKSSVALLVGKARRSGVTDPGPAPPSGRTVE